MNVPYSMDDSEPDLYGGMGGYHSDDDLLECSYQNVKLETVACPKFYTQEDMDKVIKANMEAIDELRDEIEKAYEDGYTQGFSAGVCV